MHTYVQRVTYIHRVMYDKSVTYVQLYINNVFQYNRLCWFQSVGHVITESWLHLQVLATDGDKGSFGELTYSLISGHFGDFNISTTADGQLLILC